MAIVSRPYSLGGTGCVHLASFGNPPPSHSVHENQSVVSPIAIRRKPRIESATVNASAPPVGSGRCAAMQARLRSMLASASAYSPGGRAITLTPAGNEWLAREFGLATAAKGDSLSAAESRCDLGATSHAPRAPQPRGQCGEGAANRHISPHGVTPSLPAIQHRQQEIRICRAFRAL